MIRRGSCECASAALQLFEVPPTQTAVEKRERIDYYPLASLADDGPIEFVIPRSDEDFYDWDDHTLEIHLKVTKVGGQALPTGEKVSLVDLPLHSLFSQVDTKLNDKVVSSSTATYAYKANLEKRLNYATETKASQFSSELCYKDAAGKMDHYDPSVDTANPGLVKRATFIKHSATLILRGFLHCDILRQGKFMINNVETKLTLVKNPAAFYIMAPTNDYTVRITHAHLEVTKVKLNPTLLNSLSSQLTKTNAKYPVRRSEIKTFTVPAGERQKCKDGLFTGQMPRRLVVGCVESQAFAGDVKKNPFNYQHFNLNYLSVHVGTDHYPSRALTPNFTSGQYLEAYETLFSGTGIKNEDRGLDISREEYPNGYALYVVPLIPSEADSTHLELIRNGHLRLEIKFSEALTQSVTVLVYAEYDNIIEIDKDRNIILDY